MKVNSQFPCLTKYLLLTNAEVQAASIIHICLIYPIKF
ncbi:hypothetical protein COO91_10634 (plasmid) [Nostoc flagelliforme CCNUN1]|uniref:Uncharacterized protein n=1 Tax=Nostoc flagelliforme CCNUN1 TaxID=2038116 RepID=A0A2K8T9T0_9NOSO|nr:hypothetical protein COO91_10634 [Nostoc flagelliforme CCNUN1]